jgi:ATP synthase protein I
MSDDPALDKLKSQIAKAKKEAQPILLKEEEDTSFNRLGKFFNVGVELVSGVFVGVGCGLFIDWAFGTSPWGLISLFILGSAAGMLNVYRVLTVKAKADTKKDTHV